MKKKRIKNIAAGFFPFLMLALLMGRVAPPAIAVCIALAYIYSLYRDRKDGDRKPGAVLIAGMAAYWAAVAGITAVAGRALWDYYAAPLAVVAAVAAAMLALRRWNAVFSVGALSNVCALLLFLVFSPPKITMEMLERLEAEPRAEALYLLPDRDKIAEGVPASAGQGVRSIVTDSAESTLFFSVDHKPPGDTDPYRFESIYRVDLANPADVKAFRGDRIFDVELTPDEQKLLATSYYEKKLLALDPATMSILDSRETSTYPQFILVDEPGGRVTVTHEGLGIATIYTLPDIKYHKKEKLGAAPADIAVDRANRMFYTANWLSRHVLAEVEFFSHRVRRRKFFFPPASGGVSIDTARDRIYLSLGLSGQIVGVDRKSFQVVERIGTKTMVRPVCVDAARKLIYAGNMKEPFVSVFDFDGEPAGKIYTGSHCRVFYLTPRTNRVLAGTILGVIELSPGKPAAGKPGHSAGAGVAE